jgi:N-acetylglutamate synthase-like GNAT family acetyltransferase
VKGGNGILVRTVSFADKNWVRNRIVQEWGTETVVVHGQVYHPAELDGLAAILDEKPAGLLTYHCQEGALEIVTLNCWQEKRGAGSVLLEAARATANRMGCKRLWLVTTDDNLHALGYYQKRGFTIAAIHIDAVHRSRKIKPEIPITGYDGIPIRDEIELEMIISK